MKETIYRLLAYQGDMTWTQICLNVGVSAILGCLIYISYVLSHKGTIYSRKFGVTLVALTVMTGTVMTVIGNNIALSLGMVGALSIVRFRTALKDSPGYHLCVLDDYRGNLLRRRRLFRGSRGEHGCFRRVSGLWLGAQRHTHAADCARRP